MSELVIGAFLMVISKQADLMGFIISSWYLWSSRESLTVMLLSLVLSNAWDWLTLPMLKFVL